MLGAGCMSTIRYTGSVFTRAFRANFFFRFLTKRFKWEKKIVVPCLEVILNNRIFPEKYALKFSFFPKRAHKY